MGISGRQMADGLNECLESYPEWPPGAAQFRALCEGRFIDKDGVDASWEHKGIERANREAKARREIDRKLIEDESYQERKKKVGRKHLDDLLDTF